MNRLLRIHLGPVARRDRRWRLHRGLAIAWAAAALFGLALLGMQSTGGIPPGGARAAVTVLGVAAAAAVWVRWWRRRTDLRRLAIEIETHFPPLNGLLLTAVQQPDTPARQTGYLQHRVVQEAIEHGRMHDWRDAVPRARCRWAVAAHGIALASWIAVLMIAPGIQGPAQERSAARAGRFEIVPGDTELERGESLVVLARFPAPPAGPVELAIDPGRAGARRIPLVKNLSDPEFGGTVPEVTADLIYRVEYAGQRTRDYRVTVYEHPRLERADAELTYPAYTGRPAERIPDTRRLTAIEGTRLDLTLQLNHPVATARLVAQGTPALAIDLETDPQRAVAILRQWPLTNSRVFHVQLVDRAGRTNKAPAELAIEALRNRAPEIRLATPRGDIRPSALEEVAFSGTVWDDFGVPAFGLAYSVAGQETRSIELGRDLSGRAQHPFQHLLRLEDLGAEPAQLISWHVWAEDLGPDGQTRRTTGDLFFAEVRPFDEVFRQAANPGSGSSEDPSDPSSDPGESGGGGAPRLIELQKQIISATWKLQRDHGANATEQYRKDIPVVRDSQAQALAQAEQQRERAEDPAAQSQWDAVTAAMRDARTHLDQAAGSAAALAPALAAEQSAYQALLRLPERDREVARSRSRSRSASPSAGQDRQQQQLDQLELTQSENRYETERQAASPPTAERREQLQALQRLQELARRQQDLNERLRELQASLNEARTEAEREAIRRQLKRLEEEEQQMLADVDTLRQRLDRPENQSRMSEERRQLDQARRDVQRAAEAAADGSASRALAAGARAQQQLQEIRDSLRRQSASQFADELRQMRSAARDLARQQTNIAGRLREISDPRQRTLSDAPQREGLIERLARQQEDLEGQVDQATDIARQAVDSEALLSRQLEDALRQFDQSDAAPLPAIQEELLERGLMTRRLYERLQESRNQGRARTLSAATELLRQGLVPQATRAEQLARASLDDLTRGLERAAESVLGDETEALQLASQELDQLTRQLEAEIARNETNRAAPAALAGAPPGPAGTNTNPGRDMMGAAGSTNAPARPDSVAQTRSTATPNASPESSGAGGRPDSLEADPRMDPRTRSRDRADERPDPGGRGGRMPRLIERVLESGESIANTGPITGPDFAPWSDRLRDVEEMIDPSEWRNEVASARERARQARLEFHRDGKKPDWAVVRLEIVRPLVEVRNRIAEELARRDAPDRLAPIDRDPVPGRYAELVRRYYEELGKDP